MFTYFLKRLPFVFGGIGIFFVFVVYSYLVHKNLFTQLDFNTTVKLQDHISRRFDGMFSALSYIGEIQCVTIFLLIVLAIYRKLKSFIVLLFFFGFHAFELYGKVFVNHLPPPEFMIRTNIPSNFPQFYVRTQNSFPSGHAARAAFVSLVLAFIMGKSKKFSWTQKMIVYSFLIIYDIAMFTSRVYLGEHWTTDVIGGALLGAAFAFVSFLFL